VGLTISSSLTRTERGIMSELPLTARHDGVPEDCVVSFDNLHTLPRSAFRRRVTMLAAQRMEQACQVLAAASGC
jgi:mRNA interferase MazF